MAGKRKMSRAERRRRRKIQAIIKLSAAAIVLIGVIVLVIVLAVSCSRKNAEKARIAEAESMAEAEEMSRQAESESILLEEMAAASKLYTDEEYAAAGVNEAGGVPVLMYHRIYDMSSSETEYTGGNVDPDGYNRTSEAFEADLEQYYEWGYRCIKLEDFLDGNIDVEFGCSPIIITFDDGEKQAVIDGFDSNGDPVFSDNGALAVLERVEKRHPDFNVTATFFLCGGLFTNGLEKDRQLLNWMVDNGYEIGNHTQYHYNLAELTASEIEEEVGYMYDLLDDMIPGRYLDVVALPYGSPSDTSADSKYEKIFEGNYNGKNYSSRASLLCGWTWEESIFSGNVDLTYIRRIRGYDNNGEDWDIEYNFALLNDGRRYISDGNPDTVVVPEGWGDPGSPGDKKVIKYKTENTD